MAKTKAAYLPHNMAYPMHYVLDPSIIGTADADKAKVACKYGAIDLDMQEETVEIKARHMVEVLVEDIGFEGMKAPVVKPLEGMKIAGYVGCQTNRPFGIDGESFENPLHLDKMIEIVGAEPASGYEQKVTCCGGALAFSEPEKSQKQIRDIVESAYDHGAEVIVTPCQLCQANVEIYQSEINKKKGTKLAMPVVYYSQLMAVAYGSSLKEAGLDGHVIQLERLQKIAERKK